MSDFNSSTLHGVGTVVYNNRVQTNGRDKSMRLDKYLKVSRIIKRRTVANQAADLGRIQINGKVAKPSTDVKEGDELDILMGGKHMRVRVISVREFAPKGEAAAMYEILGEQ